MKLQKRNTCTRIWRKKLCSEHFKRLHFSCSKLDFRIFSFSEKTFFHPLVLKNGASRFQHANRKRVFLAKSLPTKIALANTPTNRMILNKVLF
jgi:hypothetical protein